MSDFLLKNICKYLKQGMIVVQFNTTQCIEQDIYTMTVFDKNENFIEKFNIRKCDKDIINFIVKMEGLQCAIK